jgi:large subunit ribosomal protein L30
MRITWRKSAIGYAHDQKRTIRALGLKRLHDSIEHEDSPSIRGMTRKVKHLITIEELD